MGLNVSHDAFSGAYSSFNGFRLECANAIGGSWPPHKDKEKDQFMFYFPDGYEKDEHYAGARAFFSHSDCDGELTVDESIAVANFLESILPELDRSGSGHGHILRVGNFGEVARRFIAGCRRAAKANELLTFR